MAVAWPVVSMAAPATLSSTQTRMDSAQERSSTSREWPQGGGSSVTSVSFVSHGRLKSFDHSKRSRLDVNY